MEPENSELEMARNYALYTHRNIFLTGKAGTGKTTFLRRLQAESNKRMIVVAPTGVAAINAGGSTIHSFFQLAPGLFLPGKMVTGRDSKSRYSISKQKVNIMRALDLLVIDEISMVRADLLDAIDDVLRRYKHRDQPFGGVQLLLIGDLQQLAPVATENEWPLLSEFYKTPYFFSSQALSKTDFVYIELHHVYRQQDDSFVALLNAVRDNRLTPAIIQSLNQRYHPQFRPPKDENWITLTTHNYQAAQLNDRHMAELTTEPHKFTATVTGDFPENSYPTEPELTLKVGAQVMFCKNDPSSAKAFYNGLIGRITDIHANKVTVQCDNTSIEVGPLSWINTRYVTDPATATIHEEEIGSFTQIPLRTAWAITIHKSQGLTFDRAIINAGRAFSHGQVYVALSRCRTLEGMILSTPITADLITTDPDVVHFTNYAAEYTPTSESFIRDRRSFIEDILCDIFDFRAITMRLRYFERLCSEHLSMLFPEYSRAVSSIAGLVDTQLTSVGVKFQSQIRQLITLTDSFNSNTVLRERVRNAMNYYTNTTASTLGELFENELPEIDNSRIREQIHNEYELLNIAFKEKMAIFIACINEFSLKAYWDAKAHASMTEETTAKSTRKQRKSKKQTTDDTRRRSASEQGQDATGNKNYPSTSSDGVHNPGLYRGLLKWRQEMARERHLPPPYILGLKALIGISNAMPMTTDELLEISGIGPKKVSEYGPDLLEIVRTFSTAPQH